MLKSLIDFVTPKYASQLFHLFIHQIAFFSCRIQYLLFNKGEKVKSRRGCGEQKRDAKEKRREVRGAWTPAVLRPRPPHSFGPNSSCQSQ